MSSRWWDIPSAPKGEREIEATDRAMILVATVVAWVMVAGMLAAITTMVIEGLS